MSTTRKKVTCRGWLGTPILGLSSILAQVPVKAPHPGPAQPIQAVLLAPLDMTHVHPGSVVLARADAGWSDPSCSLNAGSLIKGHVTALTKRSKTEHNSSLQIAFDGADCRNNPGASPHFALLAMVGPLASQHHNGQDGVSEGPPLSNDLPMEIGGGGGGIRNAHTASAITDNFNLPARNLPSQIMPGQVIDVDRTSLDPGSGPGGSSVIVANRKDVRLEAGTTLVLVPAEVQLARLQRLTATTPANATSSAGPVAKGNATSPDHPSQSTALAPPPEPPDTTDVCTGACNIEPHGVNDSPSTRQAQASVDLTSLGYLPTSASRELAHFNQDTDLVYLGANHLLCTFDPKHLRLRADFSGEGSRNIRAVLLDATTLKVERVLDWRVRGDGQYLWQLANGHLLVHLGRELKEFDTDLKPLRGIRLDGRVAWVVSSPSGDHLAVGTLHERYSLAYRNELARELPDEPTDDVQVRVYDKDYRELMSVIRGLHTPPPVLSDSGELRVEPDRHSRWRITEINWQREQRLLAISHSDCRPVLSSPQHGLIFMMGCTATGGRWYRMLREDGHPVLKGDSASDELEQKAQASAPGTFAIRTVQADRPLGLAQPFHLSDLKGERITVYSSTNGSRLSSLVSTDIAPVEQGFALSPGGNQIALVGQSGVHLYSLTHPGQ